MNCSWKERKGRRRKERKGTKTKRRDKDNKRKLREAEETRQIDEDEKRKQKKEERDGTKNIFVAIIIMKKWIISIFVIGVYRIALYYIIKLKYSYS
jgi:hypothetical protein